MHGARSRAVGRSVLKQPAFPFCWSAVSICAGLTAALNVRFPALAARVHSSGRRSADASRNRGARAKLSQPVTPFFLGSGTAAALLCRSKQLDGDPAV